MIAESPAPLAGSHSTEQEILFCSARTQMDEPTVARFKGLCGQDLDEDYLINEAIVQGVLPLLHHHLSTFCPSVLSPGARDRLWDHARVMARTNLLLMAELNRLLPLFEAEDVPALTFKGPVLNAMAYAHPLLRDYTDLDFLIHREDLGRVTDLLLRNGYERKFPTTAAEEAVCLSRGIHYEFIGQDRRLRVDVHWEAVGPEFSLRRDTQPYWDRMQSMPLNGRPIFTFRREDTLLVLCIHGARHDWQQLKHICDVAEFLRSNRDLDWAQVLDQTARMRADRMLHLALILAVDLLDAPVPEDIRTRLDRDASSQRLADLVRELLFRSTDVSGDAVIRKHRLRLGLRNGWRSRIQYCVGLLAPGEYDRERLPLPSFLAAAHYITRPLRLLGKVSRNGPGGRNLGGSVAG